MIRVMDLYHLFIISEEAEECVVSALMLLTKMELISMAWGGGELNVKIIHHYLKFIF